MKPFKGENILHFVKELPDDADCKAYLTKLKWHDGLPVADVGTPKDARKQTTNTTAMLTSM